MMLQDTVSGGKDYVLLTLLFQNLECLNKQIGYILFNKNNTLVPMDTIQTD